MKALPHILAILRCVAVCVAPPLLSMNNVYQVDRLFPKWDTWTQFISDYVSRAKDLDALESSHPIEVEVSDSNQINEIFDAISYCKGASVIRMVSSFVVCGAVSVFVSDTWKGEDAFRKGLQIYLKRHQYSNAITSVCDYVYY